MKRVGCQNADIFLNKKVSICIFPLIISLIMCTLIVIAVIKTNTPYTVNVLIGVIIVLVFWLTFFIYDQHKIMIGLSDKSVNGFLFITLCALLIGFSFAYSIWGQGYLSLDPIKRVNSGLQHQDAFFLSAIAESYNRSLFPSTLVNQEAIFRYHTLDCLITNIISRLFIMPCFFVYTYLQPIIFLPLYGFLQYVGILGVRKYFTGMDALKLSDIVVVTIYNIGLLPPLQLSHFGIWKSSYVGSSSFVTANIFAVIFFVFCFHMMRTEKHRNTFLYIGIPITIFILCWSKISVGFLVTTAILYYFFRTKPKRLKYWLLNLYYLAAFLISLILFRPIDGGNAGGNRTGFQLFAFIKYCDNSIDGLCGHYFILSLIAIIFIIFDIKKKKYNKEDVVSGKTLWIELIGIITICSFLPGILLDINGGSAAYFSFFSEIPAMLLLCGHGYLETLLEKKKMIWKIGIYILLCVWMLYVVWSSSHGFYFVQKENVSAATDINIYESAMEIRELAADTPEAFTIYLDDDAQVFQLYSNSVAGIYIYPALAGVGVINASYCQDGVIYTVHDTALRRYGLGYVNHPKLSFEESLQYARKLGKTKLIHMEKDGYEIIDLGA